MRVPHRKPGICRPPIVSLGMCLIVATVLASQNDDLNARAERIAREQLERLGSGYTAKIDRQRHLIYVSSLDEEHLRETTDLLSRFHDAYRHTMGSLATTWNITIILPSVEDFRKLVGDAAAGGVYYTSGRKIISLDRSEILLHEFTHALHDADAGGLYHPMWVIEGLATLFQSSEITPSGLEPYVDGMVGTVQQAIYQKRALPLERLFKMGREDFTRSAPLAYPQCRYVMYYLWERDRLGGFYKRLKANHGKDPYGIASFEQSLTGSLPSIDKEWQEWVLKLRPKSGLYLKHMAVLGLSVEQHAEGVEITALDDSGPAKRAGRLRIGDVIQKFNGHQTKSPQDLYAALSACRATQTVEIHVLRHGRPTTVHQPLDGPQETP